MRKRCWRSRSVKGSAGQGNWAETPWVSVFDLNVTDTATRGYDVVFLVRGDGAGVALSLNHGTTEVFNQAAGACAAARDLLIHRSAYGDLTSGIACGEPTVQS